MFVLRAGPSAVTVLMECGRRQQKIGEPASHRALAGTMATRFGHTDWHHAGCAVVIPRGQFLAERSEELGLVGVGAGFAFKRAGFAPRVHIPHEAERVIAIIPTIFASSTSAAATDWIFHTAEYLRLKTACGFR